MRNRIFLVLVGALVSASSFALTYLPVTDADLFDGADLVARVELSSGVTRTLDGRIFTEYRATILDLLKGTAEGSALEIEVPGGIDRAAKRWVRIAGTPEFGKGERALVFLRRDHEGRFRVLHLSQGAFHEVDTTAGPVLVRDLTESWELATKSSGEVTFRPGADQARDRDRFVTWLRDRGQGLEREIDYLVAAPDRPAGSAEFTLLGDKSLTGRWFVFDEGRRLRWFRHVEGQAGLAGGGKKEFNRARRAWTKTRTPVRLANGGTTDRTAGFTAPDGRNTILFRDVNGTIGFPFDCATGGILAIGGFSDLSPSARPYKNLGVFEAYEAEIVVNDGVECFLAGQPQIAAQIYAHELGHTLGLGHSCGDSSSPKCSRSALLAEALMRASLSEVFGAQIRDDDLVGLRMLYDDEFYAAPCETAVPGRKGFCRRCGPCGLGQGNCRDDLDCAGILTCEKNVGDLYGFTPGTDVCVERD